VGRLVARAAVKAEEDDGKVEEETDEAAIVKREDDLGDGGVDE